MVLYGGGSADGKGEAMEQIHSNERLLDPREKPGGVKSWRRGLKTNCSQTKSSLLLEPWRMYIPPVYNIVD